MCRKESDKGINMKIYQLRYFYAACQFSNITKAAEMLHISQPSITNAIKELENEFGVSLFHRLNRGLILTKEGEVLLEKTEVLLKYADNLLSVMEGLGNKRNTIRIGLPPMTGAFLFPKLYHDFKMECPHIEFSTHESGGESLLELLQKDEIDLAFTSHPDLSTIDYHIVKIIEVENVFCISRDNPLSERDSVSISELRDEPLVLFREGFHQQRIIKELYVKHGIEPNIIHSTGQIYAIIEFIKTGIAGGFVFRELADNHPELKSVSLDPPMTLQISLVWKRDSYMFSNLMRFINFAKSYFK